MLCAALSLFILPGCNGCGGSGDAGPQCWLVTYELTGSTYFIDALVDFTITVQEPYDENLNTGPGKLVLRFDDDNGPAPGRVEMTEYSLRLNFVTGMAMAEVTTDMQTSFGPYHEVGAAPGVLDADALTWNPPEASPYCRDGQVSCTGSLCGTSGSPPAGDPFVFDNDCTEPLPLNPFVFTNGIKNFTMEAVVLSQDSDQTTSLSLVGTEFNRERKDNAYVF